MKDSDYVKINSVNSFYLIIGEVDGYFEEINGNRYLNLVFTDKNKEILTNYTELWDGIKNPIQKINNFMKIKFNSDDTLRLNKTLKLRNVTMIV